MRQVLKTTSIFVCFAATPALAQQLEGGWLMKTSNVVSPSNPSTTVEVWAAWDDPSNAFCCFVFGDFDLVARQGVFNSPTVIIEPNAFWSDPGQVSGTGEAIRGVSVGQGIVPPVSSDNPILVWSATWTTSDFTPRSVGVQTENTKEFTIGRHGGTFLLTLNLLPDNFAPGEGTIEVVPSPASVLPMVLVGAGLLRRRRPR